MVELLPCHVARNHVEQLIAACVHNVEQHTIGHAAFKPLPNAQLRPAVAIALPPVAGAAHRLADLELVQDVFKPVMRLDTACLTARERPLARAAERLKADEAGLVDHAVDALQAIRRLASGAVCRRIHASRCATCLQGDLRFVPHDGLRRSVCLPGGSASHTSHSKPRLLPHRNQLRARCPYPSKTCPRGRVECDHGSPATRERHGHHGIQHHP